MVLCQRNATVADLGAKLRLSGTDFAKADIIPTNVALVGGRAGILLLQPALRWPPLLSHKLAGSMCKACLCMPSCPCPLGAQPRQASHGAALA